MSNQNPLVPQGSMLEQKAKGKPYLRVVYVIVALHLLFLGGLLIQGCKREDQTDAKASTAATNETTLPGLDTASLYSSNAPSTSTNLAGASSATNLVSQYPVASQNPEPTTAAAHEYVVLKGDSFYSIGKKFGVTASAIAKSNPGVDSTRLKVGDKLQIPPSAASSAPGAGASLAAGDGGAADTYVVKAGDTLGKIAKLNGVGVTEIKSLNGLKTDRINVGQKLKIPAAKAAPSPSPIPATAAPSPAKAPAGSTAPPPGAVGNQ